MQAAWERIRQSYLITMRGAQETAEQLARALARRHLGRAVAPPLIEPAPISGCSPWWCATMTPPRAWLRPCVQAGRDAAAGEVEAAAWLTELRQCCPRSLRLGAGDDPRRFPGRWGRRRAVAAD